MGMPMETCAKAAAAVSAASLRCPSKASIYSLAKTFPLSVGCAYVQQENSL